MSNSDHSRCRRRVLPRSMRGHQTTFAVRSSRYSDFDPGRWWQSCVGIRTEGANLRSYCATSCVIRFRESCYSFALCSLRGPRVTLQNMNTANQPNVKFVQTEDYREAYSNSVQIRVNVWDFFLVFGTMQQSSETQVELRNFQGIYLSPQQAKALMALLQQNVSSYESTFGEIKLEPRAPGGPVH